MNSLYVAEIIEATIAREAAHMQTKTMIMPKCSKFNAESLH